jgi:hypothetical protein
VALLAAERALCKDVFPGERLLCPRTRVRFLMCGCPKVFDPPSAEVLRNTETFSKHVLLIQHANDVIPQLPLATTRGRSRSLAVVAYSPTERLVQSVIRLYSYAPGQMPALHMYHELETYASSLRRESHAIRARVRDICWRRDADWVIWRSFLWKAQLKVKLD